MYDEHYGLSARPFQLTPDARFWFDTTTHRKAMAYLGYGLAQGEGFIVITGDIGAGKTTLVGHLMATIDKERLHAINIVSTQIQPDDLLRLVGTGLGMRTEGLSKAELLGGIERGLHATARGGRRTLLVIDEAQALPVSALEELRMLSNFQAGGHALLQIFLLGQPEFRDHLQAANGLEQLRQRVIAMHHLDPMGSDEVEPYMRHRLQLVGWNGNPVFTADAYEALYRGSAGVPRRLNQLAGRVLLAGAIDGRSTIDGDLVDAVIADASGEARSPATVTPLGTDAGPTVEWPIAEQINEPEAAVPFVEAEDEVEAPVVQQSAPDVGAIADLVDPGQAMESAPNDTVDLAARVAALEARVEDQDAALRRVLTLLVDWVEGDGRPDLSALHHAAG